MHSKLMISDLFLKSFNAGECKMALKLAASRIKILRNQMATAVKQTRRELAHLLEAGKEQTARIQVEYVIREENTMSAYDLIEIYCELIAMRLPIIETQKNCPIDLKEAITSVIFAAPRCEGIPELMDLRKQFTRKYGKEFITDVTDHPDCGVSHMMIEKLSTKPPDVEVKMKVLKAVAKDHNVTWDPNPFNEHIQMPKEDLLNGPTSFTSGSTVVEPSPARRWDNVPTKRVPDNDVTTKPVICNMIPSDAKSPANFVSSRNSEGRASREQMKHTYSMDESTYLSRSNWSTEFKDATSAAEAAAEAAERASLAARAAVQLARWGSFSRQHSAVYADENGRSGSLRASRLEKPFIVKESMDSEDNKRRSTSGIKLDMEYQKGSTTPASSSSETKNLGYRQTKMGETLQGRSHCYGTPREPGGKQYDITQKSFSDRSVAANGLENRTDDGNVKTSNEKHNKSLQAASDDHTIWGDHESIPVDSSAHYGPDGHSAVGRYGEEDLLDFLLHGEGHSSNLKDSLPVYGSYAPNYLSEDDIEATEPSRPTQESYRRDPFAYRKEDIQASRSDLFTDAGPAVSERTSQKTSRNVSSLGFPYSSGNGLNEEETSFSPVSLSEEGSGSRGLNLGRLTGGLRNRRKPQIDEPPRSRIPSADTSLSNDKEFIFDATSFEARIEQRFARESPAKVYGEYEEQIQNARHARPGRNNNLPPDVRRTKSSIDHGPTMPHRCSNSNVNESEEEETKHATTAAARNNDPKHLRRTLSLQSDAKGAASLRTKCSPELRPSLHSRSETFSIDTGQTRVNVPECPHSSAKDLDNESSTAEGSPTSSTEKKQAQHSDEVNDIIFEESSSTNIATSRESSFKRTLHPHPKLPDYETLAAYFFSLRSNVRPTK